MQEKEFAGKTVEDALCEARKALNVKKEDIKYEVIEEGSSGLLGIGGKEARIKVEINPEAFIEGLDKFLYELFVLMGMDVRRTIEENEIGVKVNLEGDDLAVLIGKRGGTLDALQLISNVAANRGREEKRKIIIDAQGYKERRERSLKDMAVREAEKVKKEKRSIILNPMPPNERRIIHLALQEHKYVKTYSSGEEPMRKVVIALKED
ncbi:MAG: RNA-binding cell elongation regulator Jag/EloR [Armatimonadota bacterium]